MARGKDNTIVGAKLKTKFQAGSPTALRHSVMPWLCRQTVQPWGSEMWQPSHKSVGMQDVNSTHTYVPVLKI